MASPSSAPRRSRQSTDAMADYRIEEKAGKGSFATVFKGRHRSTRLLVAIKSVDASKLKGKVKDNLYSEIKILEKLRHPHIVALHECIETPSYIHLMMEYCALGDLSQFIKNKARDEKMANMALADVRARYPTPPTGGVNEVLIRHFLKQLASALEFLRVKNLIHRDVKPQNLLLLPPPTWQEANPDVQPILSASYDSLIPATGIRSLPMLKLADFGFARVLPATSLAETLCGSPLYMAPEILRYERYDAKADLWSVGTVLWELATGRPPFRASNHVDLLRQIERIDDRLDFPGHVIISPDLKDIILALLRRSPIKRISFEDFFKHEVVTGPIPGLVEEDTITSVESNDPKREKSCTRIEETGSTGQKLPLRRYGTEQDLKKVDRIQSPVEKPYRRSPLSTPTTESDKQLGQPATRLSNSPRQDVGEGLGIRRPQPVSSTSAPPKANIHEARRRAISNSSANKFGRDGPTTGLAESPRSRPGAQLGRLASNEQDQAQQDIAFERDYVVVDKNQVAVNALADELAANGRMALLTQGHSAPSGQMVRRTTTQGAPDSTTGAIAPLPSRAMQVAQGRPRSNTYERRPSLGSKPASFITKAIHGASNRWLGGMKLPTDFVKGGSPPQLYSPFPAYPVQPAPPIGLIGDGKQSAPFDEDARVAQRIEDFATRSDVVYGFAEVKYKQLVPLTPSMEHGLGGVSSDNEAAEGEDVLTVDAIIALSEEAMVLYVKALSLLAKSMDIASLWWTRKTRSESTGSHPAGRDPSNTQALINRINSAVQWVRTRFNEVLEKAEIVRLKLSDAQSGLPEDHPSHPNNRPEVGSTGFSTGDRASSTPGIVAEKLMYERAVDMSRRAAIDEISNGDLAGCEISYVTAICMLEAVLDKDDDLPKRRISGSSKDEPTTLREEPTSEIDSNEQQAVLRLIGMITSRLAAVRSKMRMVASGTRAQQQQQQQHQNLVRRRSGDATPRSLPSHGS